MPPGLPADPGGAARRAGRGAVLAGALAVLACADPWAGPGKLSGPDHLPVYRANRAGGPIVLDGRLDEPAWRDALQAPLVESLGGAEPRYRTVARVLWDAENLYVAFECQDDDAWSRPGRRDDDPIYEDEVVEVFLDPGGRGTDYAEIEVSPANVRFDARFAHRRSDLWAARAWSSGARSAVRVERGPAGDRGWTVELAIPIASVAGPRRPPRPGERWRMNLYRLETHNRAGAVEGSAFSPPYRPDFHSLDRFGWLVFE